MELPELIALRKSISEARFNPYLRIAKQHFSDEVEANKRAIELYHWSAELAGLFYTNISYVEVASRNAINRELGRWSVSHGRSKEWTRRNRVQDLNQIIHQPDIGKAISLIKREKYRSYNPTHDDIVARLTLSFWVNLIKDQDRPEDEFRQELWEQGLNLAFPYAQEKDENGNLDLDKTRVLTASQLSSILTLRNRIAHHDNLLQVQYELHLHRIFAVLGRIGGADLTNNINPAPLRAHIAKDPRKSWER